MLVTAQTLILLALESAFAAFSVGSGNLNADHPSLPRKSGRSAWPPLLCSSLCHATSLTEMPPVNLLLLAQAISSRMAASQALSAPPDTFFHTPQRAFAGRHDKCVDLGILSCGPEPSQANTPSNSAEKRNSRDKLDMNKHGERRFHCYT